MCLCISEKNVKETAKVIGNCDHIMAYKVISVENMSPYRKFKYKKGWNHSNRKSVELTSWERRTKIISKGFHCYMSRDGARNLKYWMKGNEMPGVICRVKIPVSDLVMTGRFSGYSSLVCTKLYFDPTQVVS